MRKAKADEWGACLSDAHVVQQILHDGERFGAEQVIRPRLGEGIFRVAVTDTYDRACAVTGEHSLPVLEAARIRPYSAEGTHEVSNGLLLRADLHKLFDRGYVTVNAEYRFRVSPQLRKAWVKGRIGGRWSGMSGMCLWLRGRGGRLDQTRVLSWTAIPFSGQSHASRLRSPARP